MRKTPSLDVTKLVKLDPRAVRLLWVNDYGGALEAVVGFEGKTCLMVLTEHEPAVDNYQWVVFGLTPEQIADEERWHRLFVEHVGAHWCFHGEVLEHEAPTSKADPEQFYAPYRSRCELALEGSQAVGWLDEMPLS